jgi:outer membrane receptor protein involved in Fe transport
MKSPFRLSLLATAIATALPVGAQQVAASAPPKESDDQKVVVTSSKRLERQRDVAGTVSVLDGADLERRGSRDQEDSLKLAPGVQFNKGDIASNTITIRGIGTQTANEGGGAQQAPTGSYLEDVPMASPLGKGTVLDPLLWDMDRVEVLRGPQGVLFGSGSLGGAVRYLFNKPRFGQFEASLKGEYASVSEGSSALSTYGMLNTPLSETVALRVVAFDRRDPGYIDNLGTKKKDANDVQQRGGRALLSIRPNKDLTATLILSSQKTDQGDTFSVSPDPKKVQHNSPNNSSRSSTTDFKSLTIDWNLGSHTLTSITGNWRNKGSALIDDTELFASQGIVVPQVYRPTTSSMKATSQELRIASNPGGALSYVAGVFVQNVSASGTGQQIDPSAAFGIATLVDLKSQGSGSERAVFVDTEYNFGNGWTAGAGLRHYRTEVDSSSTGTQFGAPSNVGPIATNDSGVTPKFTTKYKISDNAQWYAVASKGYRYGGVNGSAPFKAYKSDSLWSYETGVRLSPSQDLQVNLTAFLLDWKDAQFTYFIPPTPTSRLPQSGIDNVGKARSTGLEAQLRYRLTASLDVAASAAFINAETQVPVAIPAGRSAVTAPAGSRLPGTPDLQTALQTNYRFAGPFDSQGRVNATYTHVGDRVMFLGGNKPADAYDTIDLGINFAKGNWTVASGLMNAGNSKGVMSITGAPAGVGTFAQYFLQRPRTFTVSVRYDY